MHSTFKSVWWQITYPPPWEAQDSEHCVEFTQPEGTGALHISGARKENGEILDSDTLCQLREACPEDTEMRPVKLGSFTGYSASHVDCSEDVYWKLWFVGCGRVLLFVTYNCKPGEEDLEMAQVFQILSSLECRNEHA